MTNNEDRPRGGLSTGIGHLGVGVAQRMKICPYRMRMGRLMRMNGLINAFWVG